ncbi:MAG: UDP-N-acetylglucosamine 2-epimerase, partial [Sedimentisphaerales bacterium]|nr:UDP-N-acetylglucosamine 2-epimerase [Sedimentisphaerales bacterium]
CLATVHRAENTDDRRRLEAIVAALNRIADPACPVVLPLHPRTIRYVETYGLQFDPQVRVVPPVSYLSMVVLERNARVILTDSGGVQKEAYCLGVPCVTLRDETEWVETVQSGWNVLAGADCDRIVEAAARPIGRQTIPPETFYGAGDAADRICRLLVESTALARDDVTEGAGRQ